MPCRVARGKSTYPSFSAPKFTIYDEYRFTAGIGLSLWVSPIVNNCRYDLRVNAVWSGINSSHMRLTKVGSACSLPSLNHSTLLVVTLVFSQPLLQLLR